MTLEGFSIKKALKMADMFYRKIENTLNNYYNDPTAPIMVVTEARQIGKSFIIKFKTLRTSYSVKYYSLKIDSIFIE